MLDKNIKTAEDFFEYLVGYMTDGDTLECETLENEETGEEYNHYVLYGGGFSHYPLMSWDVVNGLEKY